MKKHPAPSDLQAGSQFPTKKYGDVTVIDYYNCDTVLIFFNNTGTVRATTAVKLRAGDVIDRSATPNSMMVGETYFSPKFGILTIVSVDNNDIVSLKKENGEEVRLLMSTLKKMKKTKPNQNSKDVKKVSLSSLSKTDKESKEINKIFKKVLKGYGS